MLPPRGFPYRIPNQSPLPPLRIIALSDTHGLPEFLTRRVPECDILIHAGDFTAGTKGFLDPREVRPMIEWMGAQPATHKIMIPGNHDFYVEEHPSAVRTLAAKNGVIMLGLPRSGIKQVFSYTASFEKHRPIKLFMIPYTLPYGGWAFMAPEARIKAMLEEAKQDHSFDGAEIIVSHGPLYGHLDTTLDGTTSTGSRSLLDFVVAEYSVRLVIHGCIHECSGRDILRPAYNREIQVVNCASINGTETIREDWYKEIQYLT